MATPYHKKPCPLVMKVTLLLDPSLVIITIYIVCLIYAWGLKEIMYFHYMTYMAKFILQEPQPRVS